jgi:SAM-dependent methyltransferase
MIELARRKAAARSLEVEYRVGPMQEVDFGGRRFDAAICMFSAIDYLDERDDLVRFLANAGRHLSDDGLLIFDYWNGIEALRGYSPVRVKESTDGVHTVLRFSRNELLALRNTIRVRFEVMLFKGDQLLTRFEEEHVMRYFFPREMAELLQANGLELLHTCPFMKLDAELRAEDWNVTVVARRRRV